MATPNIPLWEVFIRSRNGLAHKHVGSLHATDATLALQAARDIYTRRGEGLSIWVVPSNAITASDPSEKGMMFEPAESKIYRHPTFYDVPDEVGHMYSPSSWRASEAIHRAATGEVWIASVRSRSSR